VQAWVLCDTSHNMALYRHGLGSPPWLEAGVGDSWLEGIGQGCGQGCDEVAMFGVAC